MAGGVGSRFWPESTGENPKQFLDLTGTNKSLLRQTFERIKRLIPPENILIVTNRKYDRKIREELPELHPENILLEPAMRNTAPAVLFAANKIHAIEPGAVFSILPADHYIGDEERFLTDLNKALDYAGRHEVLITLGIEPDSPHTGYGYIQFDKNDPGEFKKVLRFVEKPDAETARRYLEEGNYLWNAGIFTWRTDVIRNEYKKHLPEMFDMMEKIKFGSPEEEKQLQEIFPQLQNISVDYGILEKSDIVRVLPVSFGWNDLGSWDAIHKQLAKKPSDNIGLNSELYTLDAEGNLVKTQGKKVILSGLKDYIIVESNDVLMIIPRSQAQSVKKWREKLSD